MNKASLTMIERPASIMTGKKNLEHLHTYKQFPVFFGCVEDMDTSHDVRVDMEWMICPETGVIQLAKLVPLEVIYQAQHMDGTGSTWQEFYKTFAQYIAQYKPAHVLEIGGGKGDLGEIFTKANKKSHWTIVEPNPLHKGNKQMTIIPAFFDASFSSKQTYDLVAFSHTWEHAYDPHEFIAAIASYLTVGQKLVFAYPNLLLWLRNKNISTLNFEHTMFLTDEFVDYLLAQYGFTIIDKHAYKDHSFFYTAERIEQPQKPKKLKNHYKDYKKVFLEFVTYYKNLVVVLNKQMEELDEVYIFGGHIFSQYLLEMGLNSKKITAILDNSKLKQGKRLYGSAFTVYSPEIIRGKKNVGVVLRVGPYRAEILEQLQSLNPEVRILE